MNEERRASLRSAFIIAHSSFRIPMMGDWIGLGIILLVVVVAAVGLSYLGRKPKPMTADEYERRVAEARGTTRAAALAGTNALNRMINPKAVEAVEKLKDLQAGYYDDQEKKGEGEGAGDDAPGHNDEGQKMESEEGTDA
jgi:hypothetical protein